MKIPEDVLLLIEEEQKQQNGRFIPDNPAYLKKLASNAELLTHYLPDGLAGYVFFYCNDAEKKFSYVTLISTNKKYRQQGIGSNLIRNLLSISKYRGFKECRLEVYKSNTSAISFYKKLGFKILDDSKEKILLSVRTE